MRTQTLAASAHLAAAGSLEARRQAAEAEAARAEDECVGLAAALAKAKAARAAAARTRLTEAQRATEAARFYASMTSVLAAAVAT